MLDFNQVKQDVVGRWPGILSAFGISVGNGKHQACPVCGGKDRFRFTDKDSNGMYICNQCGAGDGWSLLQKVLKVDFKAACEEVNKVIGTVEPSKMQPEKPVSPEKLRKVFKESKPCKKGDLVHQYLYYRGLTSMPKTLRYTEKCWEPETKQEQRAMLAIFHSPENEALTIHRTYLSETANKLKIEHPKKIMPPLKKMNGGACRLYEYTEGVLGIAEGIETAIAVHNYLNIPVWAATTAVLLECWEPPKQAKQIKIFGDNDLNYTGQKAAYILANRIALQPGREVEVFIPEKPGTDWLDEWGGKLKFR